MKYVDPHIHMVSRTTDDYMHMALAGCVCVTEPAFWNGFDRGSVEGFRDYFLQLTQYEPKRAAKYGIEYYSWICINPKEADDPAFAREVIAIIPEFLEAKCVVGIELVDRSIPGFWEVRGYPDHGEIKGRVLLDVNTGRQRRIPGGEVIEFLD